MQLKQLTLSLWASMVLAAGLAGGQSPVLITIDASKPGKPISRYLTAACVEDVNHEIYGGLWSQMIFGESFQEAATLQAGQLAVSGMWRDFARGNIHVNAMMDTEHPYIGTQSQKLTFIDGSGEFGIENSGLNHQGIGVVGGKAYDGYVWLRSQTTTSVDVTMSSAKGTRVYATATIRADESHWHRYDFSLMPDTTDRTSQFEIKLKSPGSIAIGYVYLEPGGWGRFAGLPVRRDVVEGLLSEGITGLRYGGSMVNTAEYRWKNMIGPPDRRPPYRGHWYPQSSNGWGIIDFLNLCEAAKLLAIPDFNIDEKPADMVDFIEYAKGPVESRWGQKRVTDGHPAAYGLTHLELGNEERIDSGYYEKFAAVATAIWSKDPKIVLVVGDFLYSDEIKDPLHITGADSHITTMAAHRRILALAKKFSAEVWFDVHIQTESPPASRSLAALRSYIDAIDSLAQGAKHHVVVFELNAGNHFQRRALANAQALVRMEKDGRLPFVSSANCLQVDRQNDNGWDQGLLFLNPSQVWLQPPGYVELMFSRSYLLNLIDCSVSDASGPLEAAATLSDDSKHMVLQVINTSDKPITTKIKPGNSCPVGSTVGVETMSADPADFNPVDHPDRVHPLIVEYSFDPAENNETIPPNSISLFSWSR